LGFQSCHVLEKLGYIVFVTEILSNLTEIIQEARNLLSANFKAIVIDIVFGKEGNSKNSIFLTRDNFLTPRQFTRDKRQFTHDTR